MSCTCNSPIRLHIDVNFVTFFLINGNFSCVLVLFLIKKFLQNLEYRQINISSYLTFSKMKEKFIYN